ncbi:hypothetical protein VM1G_09798 [Cytospora mali]|uniref:Uncharacterized protein n=1 Tax=Cytospora mali TaxID=578113 RepID=A0A194WCR7_CYTMA|nr:hypothetical protein VM1G_09798 [Valsa mali]
MSSNTPVWWQKNGSQSKHVDTTNSSTSMQQQTGGRKSLLERLMPDTPPLDAQQPHSSSKEPRYLDVTAAFFGKQRRQPPQVKQPPPVPPPQRHGLLSLERTLQQQKTRDRPDEPRTPDAPLAKGLKSELDQNIATEGSHIYSDSTARLSDLYKSLMDIVATTSAENDRVIALAKSQNRNITKPLSSTKLQATTSDGHGKLVSRQIHIGEQVDAVREQLRVLEAEIGRLWDAWEAAEQEVQNILASMTGGGDYGSMGQVGSTKIVQDALAREMEKYNEELERILEKSHEEVRMSEKEVSKKINGVMSALLQQYLLED